MISNEDKALIKYLFGEGAFSASKHSIMYRYIANPDGSMRWIFPASQRTPSFLSFYSTPSFRSKILGILIRVAFFLRLPSVVTAGATSLNVGKDSRLGKILAAHDDSEHSIFTGTLGENRKVVIELNSGGKTFEFVKIGVTDTSIQLVDREINQLRQLEAMSFDKLSVPKVMEATKSGVLELTNIKPEYGKQHSTITDLHIDALTEVYQQSHRRVAWPDICALQDARKALATLADGGKRFGRLKDERLYRLLSKVEMIAIKLQRRTNSVPLSLAHGDFTPWNMYVAKDSLYLFDWELSQLDIPMMYDIIHFVFQSQVMISRSNYSSIYTELSRIAQLDSFKKLVDDFGIDFDAHYQFYLVYVIAYYVAKYVDQDHLHEQAYWLFDAWEEGVDDLLGRNGLLFHG